MYPKGLPSQAALNHFLLLQLAFSVDDDKIREIFKLAGRLVKAEVVKDREGKSRGYAIVDYSHPVEAVQAISMFNNQRVNGPTFKL